MTGGTSGVGEATARQLGAAGHAVLITARAAATGSAAQDRTGAAHVAVGDLSLMSGVASVADQITELGAPVSALILNAAVAVHTPDVTAEGFATNYATNVLGPLLMEQRLEPRFTADARVVVVGSSQHAP